MASTIKTLITTMMRFSSREGKGREAKGNELRERKRGDAVQ